MKSVSEVPAPPIQHRLDDHFLADRRIFLWGQVDDDSARYVIERLLYLDDLDPARDISLWINCPGGLVTAGLAMLDTMNSLRADVSTVCMGLAASFGAMLLLCGAPGKRFAQPHSRIMLHQPSVAGEYRAPAIDLRIHADEVRKSREELNRIIAERCRRDLADVTADTDRDLWLSPDAAVEYGVVDAVLRSRRNAA